jgi:hypothetical protein
LCKLRRSWFFNFVLKKALMNLCQTDGNEAD